MADLDKLIAAVEAGEASWNRLASIAEDAIPPKEAALAATANKGSLDAALALFNALLPGWSWEVGTLSQSATIYPPSYPGADFDVPEYSAENPCTARALLIAILKAHRAQVQP